MRRGAQFATAGGSPESRNASGRRPRGLAARLRANATGLRARALVARLAAECCGACGRALAADETVWLSRVTVGNNFRHRYWQTPMCGDCRQGGRWLPAQPCGGCGRPVAYRASRKRRRHVLCSDRCRRRWYNRAREQETASARRRFCVVCGRAFAATRRDALTCSPACRQRGYRTRMTRPEPPQGAGADGEGHGGSSDPARTLERS
jgi:hypothetical protein